MKSPSSSNHAATRATAVWPHRLAVLLVLTTFPLIWVGGLVTTTDAGMAVPDWPETYGYNMFLYPWHKWLFESWDVFVEHGHRQLGAIVGLITISLAVALCIRDSRLWLRWLGLAAVVAVIAQGVLGGLRVIENERLLAQIHGTFGPAFFALTVALAAFTSRWWRHASPRANSSAGKVQRLAWITTGLAYLQLALGARARHMPAGATSGEFQVVIVFHLLLAAALGLHILLLAIRVWRLDPAEPALLRPALALACLLLVQVALGAGTWVSNYGWPTWFSDMTWTSSHLVRAGSFWQAAITTAHAATGSLIVGGSLLMALRAGRLLRASPAIVVPAASRRRIARAAP
jgi:cytochrome c oxidase assembly protein subunit 15